MDNSAGGPRCSKSRSACTNQNQAAPIRAFHHRVRRGKRAAGLALFRHPSYREAGHIVADLNVDMFLPLFPLRILTVLGLDESDLGKTCAAWSSQPALPCSAIWSRRAMYLCAQRSVQFHPAGIPALAFKVGYYAEARPRGHREEVVDGPLSRPSTICTLQPVDLKAAGEFNGLLLRIRRSGGQSNRAAALERRQLFPPLRSRQFMNPLNPPKRLLMGPGPSMVRRAFCRPWPKPIVGYLDPYCWRLWRHPADAARAFGTRTNSPFRFPAPAARHGSRHRQLHRARRQVRRIREQAFSDRITEMARRQGGNVVASKSRGGEVLGDVRRRFHPPQSRT